MAARQGSSRQLGVTRRRFSKTVLGGSSVTASAILAACGGAAPQAQPAAPTTAPTKAPAATAAATAGPSPTPQPNANTQPQHGAVAPTPRNQTVVIDQTLFQVFDSFNPFIPNGQQYQAGFQQACKEFLFYANFAAGKVEPHLGTGWKYDNDFKQLTISLNPKAHWNDGQPLTSTDVKFSIEMLIKNTSLLGTGNTDMRRFVDSVNAPDPQTAVIKLKTANPRFHYNFICGIVNGFEVVPEHIWSKIDPTTYKDNPPVRSGPYKLDRVIPEQLMFVWKKDPNYWNKANLDPKPEYVVYRTAPVVDSDVEEFKRGDTDLGSFDYAHMKAIKDGGYKNILIETAFRDPCPRGLWINSDASKGVLADPRGRAALSYLLDRKKIGDTIWLIQTPAAQYPWADYKSNGQWENSSIANDNKLVYDPKKAAALLDEAGAKAGSDGKRSFNGKPVQWEIMTPAVVGNPEHAIAQLLADELGKIGIDATARSYTNSVWTQKWNEGDFDISSHWTCGVAFDPEQLYTGFQGDRAVPIGQNAVNGNQVRLKDPTFDDVTHQLDASDPTDPKNKALFDKALTQYYKLLPTIPIIQTTYPTPFNTTYWTGWPTDDNLYHVPANWWGQFLFVLAKLQPTGAK